MPDVDQKLSAALDAVLSALIEHREQRPEDRSSPVSAAEIMQRPRPTADGDYLDRLTQDPVGGALRAAVKRIGEIAHQAGGMPALGALESAVRRMSPEKDGRRAGILDSAWDGIGSWRT